MCSASRLLIIDDDRELCDLLKDYLGSSGFAVDTATDPHDGARKALSGQYAAAVLDVMMPGLDGFEVLRLIRAKSKVPVVMLTARGEEADRIVGLDIGADDYLPKPFNPRELVARLRAVLRRTEQGGAATRKEGAIVVDDVRLDPGTRTVERGGEFIEFTSTEFDLLAEMLKAAGSQVTREELSRNVFGRPMFPEDRSIDVHISHIRRKLGPRTALNGSTERIKTLRGAGYLYVSPDDRPA